MRQWTLFWTLGLRYGCIYNNHLLIPLLLIPLPWMLPTLAAHTIALSLSCANFHNCFIFMAGELKAV